MPGIIGLLFHEFAMTLSIAILISLVISLTVTPTMAAYLLRRGAGCIPSRAGRCGRASIRTLQGGLCSLAHHRAQSRAHCRLDAGGLIALNVFLLRLVPSTFFPEQDNGILQGQIIADQSISFQAMEQKLAQLQAIVEQDPAVASVAGFAGGRALNTANVFVELKALSQRKLSASQVVSRLRPKLNAVSGARLLLQAAQDLRIGGRQSAPISVHADQR